jgi:hypothetical protein
MIPEAIRIDIIPSGEKAISTVLFRISMNGLRLTTIINAFAKQRQPHLRALCRACEFVRSISCILCYPAGAGSEREIGFRRAFNRFSGMSAPAGKDILRALKK